MRDTPETDKAERMAYSCEYMVPTEFARKLERERDEARRKLNNLDVTAIHSCHNECQRPICVLRRERDEAREALASREVVIAQQNVITDLLLERDEARIDAKKSKAYKRVLKETNANLKRERDEAREKYATEATEHMLAVNKVCNERDEARDELHDIRLNLGEDADGYTLLHAVCVIQNERDEMREKLSARWQSLRDSQDEVLRLTFENRELSQSIEGWEALNKILKNE